MQDLGLLAVPALQRALRSPTTLEAGTAVQPVRCPVGAGPHPGPALLPPLSRPPLLLVVQQRRSQDGSVPAAQTGLGLRKASFLGAGARLVRACDTPRSRRPCHCSVPPSKVHRLQVLCSLGRAHWHPVSWQVHRKPTGGALWGAPRSASDSPRRPPGSRSLLTPLPWMIPSQGRGPRPRGELLPTSVGQVLSRPEMPQQRKRIPTHPPDSSSLT